jgi:hypothetical protein
LLLHHLLLATDGETLWSLIGNRSVILTILAILPLTERISAQTPILLAPEPLAMAGKTGSFARPLLLQDTGKPGAG